MINVSSLLNKLSKWWESTYYICYRFFDIWIKPSTWAYRLRRWYLWFFVYGFNPKDLWSLDYTISKWIVPRLKILKEVKHGVPSMIYGDVEILAEYEKEYGKLKLDTTEEDVKFKFNDILWSYAIEKMIRAFELTIEDEFSSTDEYITQQEEIQQGMKYFGKYFNCLWD